MNIKGTSNRKRENEEEEKMDVMSSPITCAVCAVPIIMVIVASFLFMKRAYVESQALGMDKGLIKKVIINSAIVSIVPSFPIVISMAILMPSLGQYIPWYRLSVIGAATYEAMAGEIALTSVGVADGLGATYVTNGEMISVIWVMTMGCLTTLIATVFLLKKFDNSLYKKVEEDGKSKVTVVSVMASCSMLAVMACFVIPEFADTSNVLGTIGGAVSAIVCVVALAISKKFNVKWIQSFLLPICMIVSMTVLVVISL